MDIFHNSPGPFKAQGGVIECCCNWEYVPGDPESVLEHATEHAKWTHSVGVQGRAPVTLARRERMKDEGRRKRRNGATMAERVAGAEEELGGYYHRSFDEAIKRGYGLQHPTEVQYIRTAAEDDMLRDPDVSDVIHAKYEFVPRPAGRITGSYWEP